MPRKKKQREKQRVCVNNTGINTLELLKKCDKELLVNTFWKWKAELDELLEEKGKHQDSKKKRNRKGSKTNVEVSTSKDNVMVPIRGKPETKPIPFRSTSLDGDVRREKLKLDLPIESQTALTSKASVTSDSSTAAPKKKKRKRNKKKVNQTCEEEKVTDKTGTLTLNEVKLFIEGDTFKPPLESVKEFEEVLQGVFEKHQRGECPSPPLSSSSSFDNLIEELYGDGL